MPHVGTVGEGIDVAYVPDSLRIQLNPLPPHEEFISSLHYKQMPPSPPSFPSLYNNYEHLADLYLFPAFLFYLDSKPVNMSTATFLPPPA